MSNCDLRKVSLGLTSLRSTNLLNTNMIGIDLGLAIYKEKSSINSIAFSKDSSLVAYGFHRHVKVCDDSGMIAKFAAKNISSLQFSPNTLLFGIGSDSSFQLFDLDSLEL